MTSSPLRLTPVCWARPLIASGSGGNRTGLVQVYPSSVDRTQNGIPYRTVQSRPCASDPSAGTSSVHEQCRKRLPSGSVWQLRSITPPRGSMVTRYASLQV